MVAALANAPGVRVNTMATVDVEVTATPLAEVEADVRVLGLADGEELPAELQGIEGAGDVRTAARKTTLLRPHDARVLIVGLGPAERVDAEGLRVAAAIATREAGRFDATSVAWGLPAASDGVEPASAVAALAEGTILASFRFDRYRGSDPDDPQPARVERLTLSAGEGADVDGLSAAARIARVAGEAANRARELQSLPANVATPSYLAERAREISEAFEPVSAEVFGRERISELGMGGLEAVSKGSAEEPQLIVLRYSGGSGAPSLGLVGKAVTFDTGGISIKPSAKMEEMKMDMSGGAAVLEAVAAIAELGLPIDIVAVVPATENMPSGTATRPGDIITQLNGKTVEVNNTDAEGRLILADALTYCARELEAERIVDVATLTGAVVVALGSTYAGLMSNDEEWAEEVRESGERTGELAWRLPFHPEFKELTKGTVADLTNKSNKRKAGTIYAAEFLEEFVEDKPWVHLDIAGTAWDVGREYVGNGPTGFGVRLLVELARGRVAG
jgi:leucyl aminopeptidase